MRPESRQVDLTRGHLLKAPMALAGPAVLQSLLANFYGLNDFFFVGQLGVGAMTAALSAGFALSIINNALVKSVAIGATTLMAQQTGRREPAAVRATFIQAVLGAIGVGIVLAGVGWLLVDVLVATANVSEEVHRYARQYFLVLLLGNPFFAVLRVVEGTYRARGNATVPLRLEAAALATNTILTAILVLGWFGLPSFGVAGAAAATVLSLVAPAAVGALRVARGDVGFRVAWRDFRTPDAGRIGAMLRIGIFGAMSSVIYGVIFLLLNRLAGEIGPAAQGGLGVGLRGIEWAAFAISEGFFVACVTHMGQNLGAGKARRAVRGTWAMVGLSALLVQGVSVAFFLWPEQLAALVAPDEETVAYGARYLWIMSFGMWGVAIEMTLFGALVGAGRTGLAMALGLLANGLRIPFAAWILFGADAWLHGTLWAFTGMMGAPERVGGFDAIALAICLSAIFKAALFSAAMLRIDWNREALRASTSP